MTTPPAFIHHKESRRLFAQVTQAVLKDHRLRSGAPSITRYSETRRIRPETCRCHQVVFHDIYLEALVLLSPAITHAQQWKDGTYQRNKSTVLATNTSTTETNLCHHSHPNQARRSDAVDRKGSNCQVADKGPEAPEETKSHAERTTNTNILHNV